MRYDELTDDQRAEFERIAAEMCQVGFPITGERIWSVGRHYAEAVEQLHSFGVSYQRRPDECEPVEVALRAKIENAERRMRQCVHWMPRDVIEIEAAAYRVALSIVEEVSETLRAKAMDREQHIDKNAGLFLPVASGQLHAYKDALALFSAEEMP